MARPKGSVGTLPSRENIFENGLQPLIELGESTLQQGRQINAFGIIVQFAPIDRESRRLGKRLRQSLLIKEMLDVIIDSSFDRRSTVTIACQPLDFRQCLHYETCMEVIDKTAFPIHGVKPRSVLVLRLQHEVHV